MKNLKKSFKVTFLLLVAVALFTTNTLAEEYTYSDSWGKQGFELSKQMPTGIEVNFSITSFELTNRQINDKSMVIIDLPGNLLPNNEGAPNVPGVSRFIAIPQGANAEVKIISSRTESIQNVDLAPAPRIPLDTDTGPLLYDKNLKIYSKNEFFPEQPVIISEISKIRGVDVVMLGITPFQYNPVSKELIIFRDIKIEITYNGGNGNFGDNRLRSRWWDPIVKDAVLNPEVIPDIDYSKKQSGAKTPDYEYIIITPNDPAFISWADSIKAFRTKQGISTSVVTTSEIGGNTISAIENYVNDAYNTWDFPPAAVLLLGDYGSTNNTIVSPMWNSYCVSDNIFADVDGDDLPDVIFARMTAQNETHLETMITKFLNYERNPPVNPDFYHNPISALGWQDDRWFQICSEVVGGFWNTTFGKETVRINALGYPANNYNSGPWSTNPNTPAVMNYFGPSGLGYLPATPQELGGFTGGNATMVNNAVNSGAFMLQHRDHGGEDGWGEPYYTNSDINGLTNSDLVWVFSINCLTGKYNINGECFVEKFHRYTHNGQNSGALGLTAASEVSYSFVNDTYVWGMYDNLWPDFMPFELSEPEPRGILPAFGNAAGKIFLQQSSWPYNPEHKVYTHHLFHHHGDAFSTVYSEVPQNLTVSHNPVLYAGVTNFNVTADEGAFIALTVNGEIIGTAEATGTPVSIEVDGQLPPNQMLVVITKQNYYRYSSHVEIIPPSGPYVVQESVEINDNAGNGNSIMETGESILACLILKNVGVEDAENVSATISSEDEFITITDNSEVYGTIAAGATSMVDDGYAWDVANNIPDMHGVAFEVNATDGNDTWTTYFSIVGHAPNFEVENLTIDDSGGNGNGRLDPGETADIIIQTKNAGSYDAFNTTGNINSSSGYLTINNTTYDLDVIAVGETKDAVFNVTAAGSAPVGTVVDLIYDVTSGEYDAQKTFATTIGLILEDWESGNMDQFNWQTSGSGNWAVSQEDPHEGIYCAESGNINHNQTTTLELDYEVMTDDVISFWYKVSSEGSWDYFRFFIDGNEQNSWSGEVTWAEAEFDVSAGIHTFKWVYDKDGNVSNGSDCAWIDFIILPPSTMTTAYAGLDAGICNGDDFLCEGTATSYNSVEWSSSGTGSFNDNQILTPVYSPSSDDILSGSVVLSLTAYGSINVTDDMNLSIDVAANASAGDDDIVCDDSSYELLNASADNYISLEWTTTGDGMFDDNTTIHPFYTPGAEDITSGSTTLSLTAIANGGCPDVTSELLLSIEPAASVYAGEDNDISNVDTYYIENAAAENFASVIWETAGDGSFDDPTLVNPTYTPGTSDIENLGVALTMTATGNSACGDVNDDMLLSIHISGINDNYGNYDISVFPNPNTGQFTFELNGEANDIVRISIINSLGKSVYKAENIRINKSYSQTLDINIDKGVYFLKIEGKEILVNKKIIIKN